MELTKLNLNQVRIGGYLPYQPPLLTSKQGTPYAIAPVVVPHASRSTYIIYKAFGEVAQILAKHAPNTPLIIEGRAFADTTFDEYGKESPGATYAEAHAIHDGTTYFQEVKIGGYLERKAKLKTSKHGTPYTNCHFTVPYANGKVYIELLAYDKAAEELSKYAVRFPLTLLGRFTSSAEQFDPNGFLTSVTNQVVANFVKSFAQTHYDSPKPKTPAA